MGNIIGSGEDALREWVQKCYSLGGIPLVRREYRGKPLANNGVGVNCLGKNEECQGGIIINIPDTVLQELESRKYKKYKLFLAKG
jgi:hypothetical protein